MLTTAHRLALTTAVVVILSACTAARAEADTIDPVNCQTHPTNPQCVIVIGTPGSGTGDGSGGGSSTVNCRDGFGRAVPCYIPGKGWLGDAYCYYQRAEGAELAAAEAIGGKVAPPAYWYVGACGDATTGFFPPSMTTYRAYSTNPGVSLLAQAAIRSLQMPAPTILVNPAPPAPQVVYVPTWLRIDPVAWTPRTATASLNGLSVTAVATPTNVIWTTGDGGRLTCGTGTAWTSGTDPAASSPDCGYTYTTPSRSTPGGAYTLTAAITWQVTWSGGGSSGTEPGLTSAATATVRVVEAGAVNTR